MIRRLNKVLFALLIVSLALYIVQFNKDPITLRLSNTWHISATAGVIYIAIFIAGFILASLGTLFLGIKSYFRERRYKNQEKAQRVFFDTQIVARSQLAAKQWKKARASWEKIIKKDPTNIIARVEFSKSLQGEGRLREALQVLDSARASEPNNVEVLFRAAELNLSLGNKTAAIDNLALILYHSPNIYAAELARDLSLELGRIEDAIEYQSRLNTMDYDPVLAKKAIQNLEYQKILKHSENKTELVERLKSFIKKNEDYSSAFVSLAQVEEASSNFDSAAKYYVAAAKNDHTSESWHKAIKLWLENNMPEKALSAARSAIKTSSPKFKVQAELNLIRLCLELGMLDEAENSLDELPKIAENLNSSLNYEQEREILVLKGTCLNSKGKYQEARQVWKKLANFSTYSSNFDHRKDTKEEEDHAPAPRLSTP
ncbi:MAG: tetratricopeptide repeat protein [Bdellovibrionales bacterium]|nr:tetratricopeptide repeat protein [Bdellovibrionales bacterium]